MLDVVRRNSALLRCTQLCEYLYRNRWSFIKSISMPIPIPAGPRNVVGPPTPGRVSGSGHLSDRFDGALKHIEEAARHYSHAKPSPGT
jgi:hypothetical protein